MRPTSQTDMRTLSHNLNHTIPYTGALIQTVVEHDEDGYRYGGVTEKIHVDREEGERTASGGHLPPAWRLPRDEYGGPPAPTLTERTGEFRHGGVTDKIYLDREEVERTASGGHLPPAWRLPRDEYGGPPALTQTERTGEFRHGGMTDKDFLEGEEYQRTASGGHIPPAWRQPLQFAETVPDPPRYREGQHAGTAPHYVEGVDIRAAGRNRGGKHRALGVREFSFSLSVFFLSFFFFRFSFSFLSHADDITMLLLSDDVAQIHARTNTCTHNFPTRTRCCFFAVIVAVVVIGVFLLLSCFLLSCFLLF